MNKNIVILMLMLPLFANAQYITIANELCQASKRGFVFIGDNAAFASDDFRNMLRQPEIKNCLVYKYTGYEGEFARRFKTSEPTMYYLDKNGYIWFQGAMDEDGWRKFKKMLKKKEIPAKLAADCLMTIDSTLIERPSQTELDNYKEVTTNKVLETKMDTIAWAEVEPAVKKEITLKPAPAKPVAKPSSSGTVYAVQLGVYKSKANADSKAASFSSLNPQINVLGNGYYQVCFGKFDSRQAARNAALAKLPAGTDFVITMF